MFSSKKTPGTNITAIGRSMTQIAVSVKYVLREMKELKPTSDDVSKPDNDSDDDDSFEGDLGSDLSPEEMKVAELAINVVCETLSTIKEVIRSITGLLKNPETEIEGKKTVDSLALKKSLGEEVYNMKFGGEVELITGLEQFKAAISSNGASVVLFRTTSNLQCKQISLFLDTLCARYPSINFLKVDIEESPGIASVENVRIVPTIKIYKKGNCMKEMVCPCQEVLESSVRHYIF